MLAADPLSTLPDGVTAMSLGAMRVRGMMIRGVALLAIVVILVSAARQSSRISVEEAILEAAYAGDADRLAALLDRTRVEPDSIKDSVGNSLLEIATVAGDFASVDVLLERGADINAMTWIGDIRPWLHLMARNAPLDIVRQLIDLGADPYLRAPDGATILMTAAQNESTACLEYLLSITDGLLDQRDARGRTALHYAAAARNPEAVQIVLEAGLDPKVRDVRARTALHGVADDPRNARLPTDPFILTKRQQAAADTVSILVGAVGNADTIDDAGITPLIRAVRSDDVIVANTLIAHGADVNHVDKDAWSPLMYALARPRSGRGATNTNMIRLLLTQGASVEARDRIGVAVMDLVREHPGYFESSFQKMVEEAQHLRETSPGSDRTPAGG